MQPSAPPGPAYVSYASRVPPGVLRAHVIMGAIQLTVGCLLIFLAACGLMVGDRSVSTAIFSGFWTGPLFIAAGATGLAGGRGGGSTKCCIISCLVLSILAAGMGFSVIIVNAILASSVQYPGSYFLCTLGDVVWFLLYLLELVVAIVQAAFACRASCCCVPQGGHATSQLGGFPGPAYGSVAVRDDVHAAQPQPPPLYVTMLQ